MDPSASTFTPITFDASHIPSDADLHGHPRAYPATDATESFVRTDYTIGIMPAGDLAPVAPAPLQIKLLQDTARTPTRGSRFAAGYDLYASDPKLVPARGRSLVSTGIAVVVPEGTYGRVAPRSGLAVKHGISTGAGVIDADYRGEVFVLLFNHSDTDFSIAAGDRIAQLVLERIYTPDVVTVQELTDTARGAGGFGSTGGFGAGVDVKMVM